MEDITTRQLVAENTAKHVLSILIAAGLWPSIFQQLSSADKEILGSIGTVVGLVALAAFAAYFTFSFTMVGRKQNSRITGYITTFFLLTSFTLCLEIMFAIALVWIPQMAWVWAILFSSLLLGAILFDYLDLMRIGLDISALEFYRKYIVKKSKQKGK